MTPRNAAIAGVTLAAALAIGGIVFDSNPTAEAGPLRDAVNLGEVVIRQAEIRFLPDAGCTMRVSASHEPVDDVVVAIDSKTYAFNGARCTAALVAAAKAVARDIGRDGGEP